MQQHAAEQARALPRVVWRDRTRPAIEVEVGTTYHHLIEADGSTIRIKRVPKPDMRDYSDIYLSGTLAPSVLSVAASFCMRGLPITEKAFTKVKEIINMATANLSQLGERALNDLCSILRSRLPENHELKTALIPTHKKFAISFAKKLREAILANVIEEHRDPALKEALDVAGQDPDSTEDHRDATVTTEAEPVAEPAAKGKKKKAEPTPTKNTAGKTVVKKSTSVPPKREKAAPQRYKIIEAKEMTLRADSERRKVYDTLKAIQGKTGAFPADVAKKAGLKESNVIGALRYLAVKGWAKAQAAS